MIEDYRDERMRHKIHAFIDKALDFISSIKTLDEEDAATLVMDDATIEYYAAATEYVLNMEKGERISLLIFLRLFVLLINDIMKKEMENE